MEKVLKIVKELKDKEVIKDYAIGGGIAVMYYVEPLLTYDLDIFFIPVEEGLDGLSPVHIYLKKKGYKTHKEYIIIEGVPVQFIPVYNELIKEAVENSVEAKYGRIKTKVIGVECLVAIMFQTFRPKDKERIIKIMEEAEIDIEFLERILKKYGLYEKFRKFRRLYYGKSS